MEKHWSHYCSMGIVHCMIFPETQSGDRRIVETIREIAEDDFFDAIEIGWINDKAAQTEARQILETSQLQIGFLAGPTIYAHGLNLSNVNEVPRLEAVQELKNLLEQAREMGATRFLVLSGADPGDTLREKAFQALLDSLGQLCEYANKLGITVTLETLDRSKHKKALIGPLNDAACLARAVRTRFPNFGLLYDLAHMPLLEEQPGDLRLIEEFLVQAHVGNCVKDPSHPLFGDLHPYFGIPGGVNGPEELAEFLRGLFAVGFLKEEKKKESWVSFELLPQGPGQTPELIIGNAKRVWRQAWTRV